MEPEPSLIELCAAASRNLDPKQPLDDKSQHADWYRDRGEKSMRRLGILLDRAGGIERRQKMIFSGHIGSGKSTELYHLKCALDGDASVRRTVLYLPISDYTNLQTLTSIDLLEAMVRATDAELRGPRSDAGELKRQIRDARARLIQRRVRSNAIGGRAGLGAKMGIAEARAELGATHSTEDAWVLEESPDPAAMLALLNDRLRALREARNAPDLPILLICDDVEKVDIGIAMRVFTDGLVLSSVDAAVIYTVPMALVYSEHRKALLSHFDDQPTVLPVLKVADREGRPVDETIDRMVEMVRPRFPGMDRVLSPAALRRLALSSGGLLRDFIRMLRDVCVNVMLDERTTQVTEKEVIEAESELRRDYGRQVEVDLVGPLAAVGRAQPRGMTSALARLLNVGAILEYANHDTWYRVHPMAAHLVAPPEDGA